MDGLERSEAKAEDKGEPEEAAAEIEAGGRRKEIADEAIRQAVCVDTERLKPPLNDCGKKDKVVLTKVEAFFIWNGSSIACVMR